MSVPSISSALQDHGVVASSIISIFTPERDIVSSSAAVRRAATDYVKSNIEFAARLGADIVTFTPTACMKISPEASLDREWAWAREAAAELAADAGGAGVKLVLEPWNRYETYLITRAEQAIRFIDEVDSPHLGYMADTFHMSIEEPDIAPEKLAEYRDQIPERDVTPENFGRIAAQTAKQVIIQKIREAERDIILEDYTKRIGTIVNGSVHRFEKGDIVLDLGKTEAILPKSQQCQGERYKQGDRIRAYILEVNKTSHGPQVILTRSDVAFVKKLFEIEVPEIMDGIVEIRSISREPGERTKIAVWSKDDKVDAVGACVGMRGSRVKIS